MSYQVVQELKANETPINFPKVCPECGKELFNTSDYRDALSRELFWDYRYCPVDGWFDLKYTEWGNMGNFEESFYAQGHVFPETISDLERSLGTKFWHPPEYYKFPNKFENSSGETVVLTAVGSSVL